MPSIAHASVAGAMSVDLVVAARIVREPLEWCGWGRGPTRGERAFVKSGAPSGASSTANLTSITTAMGSGALVGAGVGSTSLIPADYQIQQEVTHD